MLIRCISNDWKLNLNFVTYLAYLSLIRPVANNCDFSLSIIYFEKDYKQQLPQVEQYFNLLKLTCTFLFCLQCGII